MTHLLIKHKVDDYEAWKAAFDNFAAFRKSSGETSYQIFRHQDDPSNLYLVFGWDNLENANKFLNSSDLKEAMRKAGVSEQPEINFLIEDDKGAL